MKEIEANKIAWSLLSKDHYEYFKEQLQNKNSVLSSFVEKEIGNISGKDIIHIHCNTGADTISLARKGAIVTGVDLVPENIFYAKKLSDELDIKNIEFIELNTMELKDKHNKKYDMVFATEGVLYWLPDLNRWAETVTHLLKENGILYLHDSHPFYFICNKEIFKENKLEIKHPYFLRKPKCKEYIGGDYASTEVIKGENYGWVYTISDIINPLVKAGLTIEYFAEYDRLCYDMGGMNKDENGNWYYPFFDKKLPFMFSLIARNKKNE